MEIDKLLENLAVISQILKTPSLTNQIDKDPNFGIKIKEFETLVEKVKLQHGDFSMSNEDLSKLLNELNFCLLYTSPSPRDRTRYRMPSSA